MVKNPPANAGDIGDAGSIPGLGTPGGGHGNPLQYSCPGNPMDKGAWRVTPHGITKSWTQLGDNHFYELIYVVMYGCESWTVKKAEH